jgi:hypothetical protein
MRRSGSPFRGCVLVVCLSAPQLSAGRHPFEINLTNSFGSRFGQTALGGGRSNNQLGFKLARKR